jgi:hypothetical protein
MTVSTSQRKGFSIEVSAAGSAIDEYKLARLRKRGVAPILFLAGTTRLLDRPFTEP